MRRTDRAIAEVNDAIVEKARALQELKETTVHLVTVMRTEGRSLDWCRDYMDFVTTVVDEETGRVARRLFEEEWAKQAMPTEE